MRSRRPAVLALAVALRLGLAGSAAAAQRPAPSASGAVYVTTLPAGADIWIDGGYVGHAPMYIDALGPGRHRLTVVKAGWLTQETDVTVASTAPAFASFALSRTTNGGMGRVNVRGLPQGGLTIDGGTVVADRGGTIALPSGRHELSAKLPEGRVTRAFTVYPDTTTEIVLHPAETQQATHSSVVAPASDYLPDVAYRVDHGRVFVQYGGHDVTGRLGTATFRVDNRAIEYDAAPFMVNEKLYLPLALLVRLTGPEAKK